MVRAIVMAIEYEPVIGLEVHCQLLTRTKLFCGARASFGAAPNTHVSAVSLGLPGSLPVPNREAIAMAARVGLALGCTVRRTSRFARKHYFYPDLPKGYQISQYDEPICQHGSLDVPMPDGSVRTVRIERAHLEEDAGKNLHGDVVGASIVDFNRAGVPLVEIVSAPDIRSAIEAAEYLRQLRSVLMFIGVNDGNLEEGSFRCDANVSVRPVGQKAFGTRTEIKNVNSFRFVQKAIEWEIADQIATLSAGGRVEQYTKTWDDAAGRCNKLRKKEGSDDYRYFPEPDLPPMELSEAYIDGLRAALPELPAHRRGRYVAELGLPEADARVLTEHPGISAYFEALTARSGEAKRAANWVSNVLKPDLRTDGLSVTFSVSLDQMCALFSMLDDGSISSKIAKDLYAEISGTAVDPRALADAKGLKVITDMAAIEAEVRKVLDASERQVAMYRSGKKNLSGYFKGEVMKATRGRVDPKLLDSVLMRLLDAPV